MGDVLYSKRKFWLVEGVSNTTDHAAVPVGEGCHGFDHTCARGAAANRSLVETDNSVVGYALTATTPLARRRRLEPAGARLRDVR